MGHVYIELNMPACGWPENSLLLPEYHIAVCHLKIEANSIPETVTLSDEPNLSALVKLQTQNTSICVICGPDINSALSALREIKKTDAGRIIPIVASQKQNSFLTSIPWLKVIGLHDESAASLDNNLLQKNYTHTLLVGFARNSIYPWLRNTLSDSKIWWLDSTGRPLSVLTIDKPALRNTLTHTFVAVDESMKIENKLDLANAKLARLKLRTTTLQKQKQDAQNKLEDARNKILKLRSRLNDRDAGKKNTKLKIWIKRLFNN